MTVEMRGWVVLEKKEMVIVKVETKTIYDDNNDLDECYESDKVNWGTALSTTSLHSVAPPTWLKNIFK